MHVDRPGAEIVTAREGNAGRAGSGQERPEHDDRSTHLTDEIEWCLRTRVVGNLDHERVAVGVTFGPDVIEHTAHQLDIQNPGYVRQPVGAGGEKHRHHLFEGGVLGSEHCNGTFEGRSPGDDDLIHRRIVRPVWTEEVTTLAWATRRIECAGRNGC